MNYSKMEMAIAKGLENLFEIRADKAIDLLDSNIFEYCNCNACNELDEKYRAFKLIGYDKFFFRIILIKNSLKNYKAIITVHRYTDDQYIHLFSQLISIDDILSLVDDSCKEKILFSLNLFR